MKILKLQDEFNDALTLLEKTNTNVFLTGRAGTGKSTLLNLFRRYTEKNVVVLAPTGVAAINVKGETIHTFCGFPPHMIKSKDIKDRGRPKFYTSIDTLVIDEISMVRADMLDNVDIFFRKNRRSEKPFGGLQVIFVGDLYQLPPVVSGIGEKQVVESMYETPYFFSAHVFESDFYLEMYELTKVYRQEEKHFLHLLEEIRNGDADEMILEELNERVDPTFDGDGYITLCSTNATAKSINQRKLDALHGEEFFYQGKLEGAFPVQQTPTDLMLRLKQGAQVIMLYNESSKKYVNGTIAQISDLGEDWIRVWIDKDGELEEVEVELISWYKIKYTLDKGKFTTEIVGQFTQYPIALAWAITIHKSQGQTFDKAIIDLGRGAFAHGQTYVALSRCRTLDGLVLRKPLTPADIIVDEDVIQYYRKMNM